jgi:hypothetical protein
MSSGWTVNVKASEGSDVSETYYTRLAGRQEAERAVRDHLAPPIACHRSAFARSVDGVRCPGRSGRRHASESSLIASDLATNPDHPHKPVPWLGLRRFLCTK